MITETMGKIEAKIRQEQSISSDRKSELLKLLSKLETEIAKLSETDAEHAESIAGFVERSAHEVTRRKKNPGLLNLSLAALAEAVKGFEVSHPALVEEVNAICTLLANMGF